jgi:hypothetical protein
MNKICVMEIVCFSSGPSQFGGISMQFGLKSIEWKGARIEQLNRVPVAAVVSMQNESRIVMNYCEQHGV